VSFATITLCVVSQRVFIVVVYFVIDSVRKLLDTSSYIKKWFIKACRVALITPWNNVLLQKLAVTQLVKKFHTFCETRRSITVFTTARHWIVLSQMNPVHIFRFYMPKIHSNIIFPFTSRFPEWSLPFNFCDKDFIRIYHLSHSCYMCV
jgi:hypothetical protein